MPRSPKAYLADIVDACRRVATFISGVDLPGYLDSEEKRSAVERQLLIIGEAVAALRRVSPEIAESISEARLIVGFRNVLVHDYASVVDELVYAMAVDEAPKLLLECEQLLARSAD